MPRSIPFITRISALIASGLVALMLQTAAAQNLSSAPGSPENSSSKPYGSGWSCDSGFREERSACIAITVPDNAYLTGGVYGRGWECDFGFFLASERCHAVVVPENGYLDSSGTRW